MLRRKTASIQAAAGKASMQNRTFENEASTAESDASSLLLSERMKHDGGRKRLLKEILTALG